jgi:hypothetical protein
MLTDLLVETLPETLPYTKKDLSRLVPLVGVYFVSWQTCFCRRPLLLFPLCVCRGRLLMEWMAARADFFVLPSLGLGQLTGSFSDQSVSLSLSLSLSSLLFLLYNLLGDLLHWRRSSGGVGGGEEDKEATFEGRK